METRISSKGQFVLPAELRELDGIASGQTFSVERLAEGEYRLVRKKVKSNVGLVAWLRACPDKGGLSSPAFLRAESTDDL
jgi:AbrB family looped-hinge helix DNA binding protein